MAGQCEYCFLKKEQFPRVYQCFLEAFADYHLDMSYMTENVMLNRWVKNGVDFESSVGAFADGKLVGVTVIGIDRWKNENHLAAFDAGTGIIPAYRGKGIAREMFKFAIPKLKDQGVKKFLLEVLQVNKAAVKAYRKTGFKVTREFDCFQLKLENFKAPRQKSPRFTIQAVDKDILSFFSQQTDWHPSWENSFSSIRRIPDEVRLYGAFSGKQCIGLLVYYPGLDWLMSLVVVKAYRRQGAASQLLAHCRHELPENKTIIKAINIEPGDTAMSNLLNKFAFELYVNQFEMEYDI
jgi:ribosomal protein S18 acetylase RimI-like enzyme